MSIEDRIEKFARLVLVALLLATLGWVSVGNAQDQAQDGATHARFFTGLAAWWPGELQEELIKRSERRANTI